MKPTPIFRGRLPKIQRVRQNRKIPESWYARASCSVVPVLYVLGL